MEDFKIAKTKTFTVAKLREPEYNPNQMSDEEFKRLEASMEEFGVVELPVINTRKGRVGVIVGGSHRVKALKLRGNTEVDGVVVDLGLAREKELNLRLNKHRGAPVGEILKEFFEPDDLKAVGYGDLDLANWDMLSAEAAGDLASAATADGPDDDPSSEDAAVQLARLKDALGAETVEQAVKTAESLAALRVDPAMTAEERLAAWTGMPAFTSEDLEADSQVVVSFAKPEDRESFAEIIGQRITDKTRSLWHPSQQAVPFGTVDDES